jgi:hypothetical protein
VTDTPILRVPATGAFLAVELPRLLLVGELRGSVRIDEQRLLGDADDGQAE